MFFKFALLFILPCVFGQELIDKECEAYPITTQQNFDVEKTPFTTNISTSDGSRGFFWYGRGTRGGNTDRCGHAASRLCNRPYLSVLPPLVTSAVPEKNPLTYLGTWHELMRYENVFQLGGECVTATYGINDDGTVQVVNAHKQDGEDKSIEGFAIEQNPELHDGKLTVQFPESPAGNYWVLGTDYGNYSVVWSCYSFPGRSIQYLWILARKTLVPTEVSRDVERVLANNGLDANLLRPTNNDEDYCGF